MPIAMHLTAEQIEHLAVRALEIGADDLVGMCDAAILSNDDSAVADLVANDVDLAEWMERGGNLGYRTRTA